MDLEQLKAEWQRQDVPEHDWTGRANVDELRKRTAALRRTAARRDWREELAAIVVMVIFGWIAITWDASLARAGAAITVAAALFIIIWSRLAGGRNAEPPPDLPVAEFVRGELLYVERQRRLLRSVFWWYIAPSLIGVELFFLGTVRWGTTAVLFMLLPVAVAIVTYRLNRNAAETYLEPLREELVRLLRQLEANGASS